MDQKFQEGLDLWNEGKSQEGADIWMELSEHGHLVSISELFYIFLDQNEFNVAQSYIDCVKDQNDPIILFLKARLIEERDGISAAVESFKIAADAGHPGSLSLIFDWAIQDNNFDEAQTYLEKLQAQELFLSMMKEPVTIEELRQKLEKHKKFVQEILGFEAEDKVFTIAVGSDETDVYLEVRVYDYQEQELVKNFNDDLRGAVDFCSRKDRGFEVIYVGDTWNIAKSEIVYHGRVFWSENRVTIAENYEDYWFGELKDIDNAIEELIATERNWELVNYHLNKGDEVIANRIYEDKPILDAISIGEIDREELVRRVAALWEVAIDEDLANSQDVSFIAFLGAQYSIASLAGQCKITEEGFKIVELAFTELSLLVGDLDDDSDDEDDEDDE